MKPLLKKEIRLLLPAWIAAMLLAVVPMFFFPPENMGINASGGTCITVFFVAGAILLAISPFGLESGFNTFSVMLAQPVQRRRIWDVKITLLLVGLLSVLVAFWLAWICHAHSAYTQNDWFGHLYRNHFRQDLFDFMKATAWWAVAIFAGGLWTSLLLRQIIAAFWITLITPCLLFFLVSLVFDYLYATKYDPLCSVAVDLGYLVGGFLWARRLFFNAQDTQWTGGDISFQWRKQRSEARNVTMADRSSRWLSALVWKEVQLHQVNLMIAAAVLVLHLGVMIIRKIHPRFQDPDIQFWVETVWILWLLLPLLIGSAAVAEERKLGVSESQLCLPVTRRFQFWLKFCIALVLSVVLGAVMPSIIEQNLNFGESHWIDYWVFYAAASFFLVSFYASTLARSTLVAIAMAIGLPFAVGGVVVPAYHWLLVSLAKNVLPDSEIEGRLLCLLFTGVTVLLLVLAGLMYWNFKWLHQNAKLWRCNAAVLLLTFVFIYFACNAIFFRTWEWFLPLEPVHGPARLSAEQPPKLFSGGDLLIAAMPDGRMWRESIDYRVIGLEKLPSLQSWVEFPNLSSRRFFDGSDWVKISPNAYRILGIHSDGSLWCVPVQVEVRADGNRYSEPQKPVQLGSATDWADVVNRGWSFLLLKKDGSLWVWGTNASHDIDGRIKADLSTVPARLDEGNDWAKLLCPAPNWGLAQKNDGTIWSWDLHHEGTNDFPRLVEVKSWSNQWQSYAFQYQWSAGISTNGELWLFYQAQTNWDGFSFPAYLHQVKLGSDANWKAVMFSPAGSLILLRQDGTLWKWRYIRSDDVSWNTYQPEPFQPVQVGRQSDWISLGWSDIALAADGSLWSWGQNTDHLWLAPSRKPVYMGNIFEDSASGR